MLATGGVIAVSAASATPVSAGTGNDAAPAATGTTVNDGVYVSLYDYWDATYNDQYDSGKTGPAYPNKSNVNKANGGSDTWSPFQFNGNGQGINAYDSQNVTQGIASNKLGEDGNPTFATSQDGLSGKSMGYLFSDSEYAAAYENVTGLFGNVTNNHYKFDAAENFAHLDTDSKTITLSGPNTMALSKDQYPAAHPAQNMLFAPFNTLGEEKKPGKEWSSGLGEKPNYAFGMKVTANFMQPKDGKIVTGDSSEDMVFNFTGDDDVWVYVDGALVLDIGGIHAAKSGSINFATGVVTVDGQSTTLEAMLKKAGVSTNDMVDGPNGNKVFPDWSGHKLSFFYLERGHGASNCLLDFNLQTVPDDVVMVGKQIVNSNTGDFSSASFEMSVGLSDSENGPFTTYVGDYYVCGIDETAAQCQQGQVQHTSDNGRFSIKNNQKALLVGNKEHPIKANTWYQVTEYAADGYAQEDYKFSLDGVEDSAGGDLGGKQLGTPSKAVQVDKHPMAMVNNSFQDKNQYSFAVKKVMANGQTAPDDTFTVKLMDGNGRTYVGDYYHWGQSGQVGDALQTDQNGSITLKADEEIRILGLNPGTKFTVAETNPGENYMTPSYEDNENDKDSDGEQTVTVGPNLKLGQVTVTNSLKVQVAYRPFRIMKQLDGAPLKEHQFCFQVHAVDEDSAKKAGFNDEDTNQHLVNCEQNDTCVFTNQDGSDTENVKALARNANTLTFTAADVNHTFTYEYKELDTDSGGNKLPSAYVLDENTYRVEIHVEWVDESQKDLKVTTTIKKKAPDASDWATMGASFEWTSDKDKPTDDALPTVTFENKFTPITDLPLTGGATGRQWLVAGLVLGGMALLLAGATGLWRDRRRMF